MAINNNGFFRVLVDENDGTGATEISTADGTSAIGGGAVHEQEILLENSLHAYTAANRAAVLEVMAHGDGASQSSLFETSSTSYAEALHAACVVGQDRASLTIFVDYIGRVQVTVTDRAGVTLDSDETTDSPTTHTTEAIGVSWSSGEEEVLIKVEVKKTDAGSQDGVLYGVRALEDQTSLSGSLASSAFQKLDSELVSSTDMRPVDAFVLQSEDGNLREALVERARRASVAWAADKRPVLACHREVAIPLFVWPVARDASGLTVELLGLATATTGNVAVNVRLALQDSGGRVYDPDASNPTAVTHNASAQVVTLTVDDVSAVRGQPVTVWLVYESEDVSTEGNDDLTPATFGGAGRVSTQGTVLNIGSTLDALISAGERHRLSFSEDSLGTAPEQPNGFPDSVMLIKDGSGANEWWVYPRLDRETWLDYAAMRVDLIKIGTFELYSAALSESYRTPQSQVTDFRPAGLPRAVPFRALYGRGYGLSARRERVHHVGGSPNSDTVNDLHGQQLLKIETARTHGQCIVGELSTYRINTRTATLQYRRRYKVLALVAAVGRSAAGNELTVQVGADLSEFSAGSWGSSSVTLAPEGGAVRVSILPAFRGSTLAPSASGDLLWLVEHYLEGAWAWSEVAARRDGTAIVEAIVSEQVADQAESARLLQVTLAGSDATGPGRGASAGTEIAGVRTVLATFTVAVDEGF